MKVVASVLLVVALHSTFGAVYAARLDQSRGIGAVITQLEGILKDSMTDGEAERKLYATFKCYCDDEKDKKTKSIEDGKVSIEQLTNQIQEFQGSTGVLSSEVGELKAKMEENEKEQATLTEIREKENTAFKAFEEDSTTAITSLGEALTVLQELDADQTDGKSAADHQKFMAGYGEDLLEKKKVVMKRAFSMVINVLSPKQQNRVEALIQAPFTGTYTSQAVEVVGILKQMKEGFEEKLAEAKATEDAAVEAFNKLIAIKKKEYDLMEKSYEAKQKTMSDNDDSLGTKKTELKEAKEQLDDDEAFLEKLAPICETKEAEFEKRKIFRSNEDTALSEAIAILKGQSESFAKIEATKFWASRKRHPTFLQIKSRKLFQRSEGRQAAEEALRSMAPQSDAAKRVLAMLQAGNPFTVVLEKIDEMMKVIEEEAKVDKAQKEWCESERKDNGDAKNAKEDAIDDLQGKIDKLNEKIDAPETGLKALIKKTDDDLKENYNSKKTQTADRDGANTDYKESIRNFVKAKETIAKAIVVLNKYYKDYHTEVIDASLVQKGKEDPAPPSTWDSGDFAGQKTAGKQVIEMLEKILEDTKTEEKDAHMAEATAQHTYEDEMQTLMEQESSLQVNLLKYQKELATAEKELEQTLEEKFNTERDKMAIENYLEDIKVGCDFAIGKFDIREAARKKETDALKFAKQKLEDSPSYAAAVEKAKLEAMGKCQDLCVPKPDEAPCKACLADVSVPGYCSGHPGTPGC